MALRAEVVGGSLLSVGSDIYQISIEGDLTITAARQSSRDIRRHKATNYRPAPGSSTLVS